MYNFQNIFVSLQCFQNGKLKKHSLEDAINHCLQKASFSDQIRDSFSFTYILYILLYIWQILQQQKILRNT